MAIKAPPATHAALTKAVKAANGDAEAYCKGWFSAKGCCTSEDRAARVIAKVAKIKALGSSFSSDPEFSAAKAQAIADIWAAYGAMVNSGVDEYVIGSEVSPARYEEAEGEALNYADD